MAVRTTMANIIARVRILINDPNATTFPDQTVQDVLDASRTNYRYLALAPSPTYSGAELQYLDYYSDLGDWEDDITHWQYRTVQVFPATTENIVGHWTFTLTTLPPVFAIGKSYDIYRSAADLLERQAAQWVLSFNVSADGQSLQRSQAVTMLLDLAHTYRLKQRAISIKTTMTSLAGMNGNGGGARTLGLGPTEIDYMGSGNGS